MKTYYLAVGSLPTLDTWAVFDETMAHLLRPSFDLRRLADDLGEGVVGDFIVELPPDQGEVFVATVNALTRLAKGCVGLEGVSIRCLGTAEVVHIDRVSGGLLDFIRHQEEVTKTLASDFMETARSALRESAVWGDLAKTLSAAYNGGGE